MVLDLMFVSPETHTVAWQVEATVDLHAGDPVVTAIEIRAADGLDLIRLQREFRWATPLDVVTRLVPRLLAVGTDPFTYDYPATGYPRVSRLNGGVARLSDEFLEDVAREYLVEGRGYAKVMAAEYHVSERTVVSWVEKARQRGILTATEPGRAGGKIVPRSKRRRAPTP